MFIESEIELVHSRPVVVALIVFYQFLLQNVVDLVRFVILEESLFD